MEKNEMIKTLMVKANVSYEDATEALEKNNWDLLDAIVYLERKGSQKNKDVTAIIEVDGGAQYDYSYSKEHFEKEQYKKAGGFGELVGRMFRFVGKIIRKGNENFFELRKANERPIRIPLTVTALAAIFLTVPTVVLVVLGLFCGYKYSISGADINHHGVNNIFDEMSKSADNIKRDFKEGYGK